MPRSLRIGSRRYMVTRDTAAVRRYIDEHMAPPADACELNGIPRPYSVVGLHMAWARKLYVAPRLRQDIAQETLIHECLHALWIAAGLTEGPLSRHEELAVTALTQPLLALLQDNPALVRYLTEKGTP